jgi:ABC-2 type transport system permease protein
METGKKQIRSRQLLNSILILAAIVLFNILTQKIFFRIDLTSEKRYTISTQTKNILSNLNDKVFIRIYLDGELNIELKQFQKSILELLDELRIYADGRLEYECVDPFEGANEKERQKILEDLYNKGLNPVNIHFRQKDGSVTEKIIIPGAVLVYKGAEIPLNLLLNNPGKSGEENLNNSTESLEFTFISTIKNLSEESVPKIAFIEGHGEWPDAYMGNMFTELSKSFQIDRCKINGRIELLEPYKAVIIAGAVRGFSEPDKFALDQYIMRGGKVMWLIDAANVDFDSLANGYSFALPNNLNLDDMLFRYGVRINPNLILDAQCSMIPVNVALAGNQPNFQPAPWLYYPLISPLASNCITQNINLILTRFVSSIDTLGARKEIKKTPLLVTSAQTKTKEIPALIELQEINKQPVEAEFNQSALIVGVLLEGKFESVFKNRMVENLGFDSASKKLDESKPTKMIVVSDADIIRNDVRQTAKGPSISPLGFDRYSNQTYGNKDFISNAISYLTDDYNLLSLRGREFKLRLLDKTIITTSRLKWQLINLVIPTLIVILCGIAFNIIRKYKFSR